MSVDNLPPRAAAEKPIEVRSVWSENLESEFNIIRHIIDRYPCVSMDTEFPGVVLRPTAADPQSRHQNPTYLYLMLKSNVDLLNLIQIGLTLSDFEGNLPDLGSNKRYIWEFNFKEFDMANDFYSVDSIEMLKKQGIDFDKNRELGIDSSRFAELMMSSGLILNDSAVTWITFHSAYDFGYLIKILTRLALPAELSDFLRLVRVFFGDCVYDLKYMMRFCGNLYGGLNKVAKILGVNRVVGKSHQAGSDCLLTWHVFEKIRGIYFEKDGLEKYACVLYGLEVN